MRRRHAAGEGGCYRVAVREDVAALRHDLGADSADEAAEMLIFLVDIHCLHCVT